MGGHFFERNGRSPLNSGTERSECRGACSGTGDGDTHQQLQRCREISRSLFESLRSVDEVDGSAASECTTNRRCFCQIMTLLFIANELPEETTSLHTVNDEKASTACTNGVSS